MTARTVEDLRCNPLAGHLIVGLISSDALPNPFPVRFRVHWKAVFVDDTEKIGKTPSPVIRVFRRVEKCLDQSFPFLRIFAGHEFAHPLGRRQGTCQVQANASKKLRI